MKYRIDYFYLATGMEGIADTRDCGTVEADSEREAIEAYLDRKYPDGGKSMNPPHNTFTTKDFERGCLSATLIPESVG